MKIRFTQTVLEDIHYEQLDIISKEHNRAPSGIDENKQQIIRRYYFPKMTSFIRCFIKDCLICNECKYDKNPINKPLKATPLPCKPFEMMHVDILFLEKYYFLTCIDKFSKYAQVKEVKSRATIDVLPIKKEMILKHEPPDIIVMDGEKSFNSGEMLQFFNIYIIRPFVTATCRSDMNCRKISFNTSGTIEDHQIRKSSPKSTRYYTTGIIQI